MPRLYYPKESFRGSGGAHDYSERVIKLIPSEMITAFMAVTGLSEFYPFLENNIIKIVAFSLMLGFIPLHYLFLNRSEGKPIRNHIIVSCLAFIVWSYSIAGTKMLGTEYFDVRVSAVVLTLFTVLSPFVSYKK